MQGFSYTAIKIQVGLLNKSQGGIYICGTVRTGFRRHSEALPPVHAGRFGTVALPPPYAYFTLVSVEYSELFVMMG